VNFLSHFYFERYSTSAERVLGTLLPDLLKNVDKQYNFQPQRYEEVFLANAVTSQILSGWYRHVEVDKLFHSSPYFMQHCHNLRKLLVPVLEGLPIRPSFMAHIAVELMLDHLLIREKMVNPLRLYEHLEAVPASVIKRSLGLLDTVDVPKFMDFYERFLSSRYIIQYAETKNVSYALFNICKRIWVFEVSDEQRQALTELLEEYLERQMKDFVSVFHYIQEELS